jgi:hypothetical protein
MALIQKAFSDIITFSRTSNATRVGPTGLVEYAPHNLILQSQTFDNAAWTKGANVTVTANAAAAPDGTVTADLVVSSASADSSTNQVFQQVTVASSQTYTTSFWVRTAGANQNITVRQTANGVLVTNTTVAVTSTWQRVSVTFTASTNPGFAIRPDTVSNLNIYVWGAQLAVGPYALDYTPTTSAAVYGPRFDFDPVTLAPKGLLVEEQRTNLCLYSEQFDNAWWSKTTATVTANSIASPDGTLTADLVTATAGGGGATVISSAITVSASTAYTYSIFIKTGTATSIQLRLTDNVTGQALITANLLTGATTISAGPYGSVTASSVEYANGWRRFIVTGTQPSGQTSASVGVYLLNNADTVYLWGAQLEAGSFATSLIPTLASTVTRSADVASVNTLSPWFNNVEGAFFAEFSQLAANSVLAATVNPRVLSAHNGSTTTAIDILTETTGQAFFGINAGSAQWNISRSGAVSAGQVSKFAGAFKVNDIAASLNGGTVGTDTSATIPTVTTLQLANRFGSDRSINGHLRRVAFYPRRLLDAELQALTS